MLRFLKAIKIKVLCDRLVEIQYYDASKRLKTLNEIMLQFWYGR